MKNTLKKLVAGAVMALGMLLVAQPATAEAASKKYVKSLKVSSAVTVTAGQATTVKPKLKVVNRASKKLTVKSANKKIAKVKYSAKKNQITITGVAAGTTKVTVATKAKAKNGKKLSKKIKVTVAAPAPVVAQTPAPAPAPAPAPVEPSAPVTTTPLTVSGVVLDPVNGEPLPGVTVTLTSEVAAASKGLVRRGEGNTYTVVTDENGRYQFIDASVGGVLFSIRMEGAGIRPVVQYVRPSDYVGTGSYNNGETETLDGTVEETNDASINGRVVMAVNGSTGLSGMHVELRNDLGNIEGAALAETDVDEDGYFTFENLPSGYYTVSVYDPTGEYMSSFASRVVRVGAQVGATLYMTKTVDEGAVRFVLTWDDANGTRVEDDLDSHLIGPGQNPDTLFHVYFGKKIYTYDDSVSYYNMSDYMEANEDNLPAAYAYLDWDDTTYEGPETTTLHPGTQGMYYFYIYNFSNDYDNGIASSHARVNVYKGEMLVATFAAPATGSETRYWRVCGYNTETGIVVPFNDYTDGYYYGDTLASDHTIVYGQGQNWYPESSDEDEE